MSQKKISIFILVCVLGSLIVYSADSVPTAQVDKEQVLKAWWTFEKTDGSGVLDTVTGVQDSLEGHFRHVKGSTGDAIKFDGFTTLVTRKASKSPKLEDQFTIHAWVAVAAYPWNWCPIVSQQKDQQLGLSFGGGLAIPRLGFRRTGSGWPTRVWKPGTMWKDALSTCKIITAGIPMCGFWKIRRPE